MIMRTTSLAKFLLSISLTLFIPSAYANSLHDLQQALKKFDQNAPFSAQVTASVKKHRTEDDDKKVKEGVAQFSVEQSPAGLHIILFSYHSAPNTHQPLVLMQDTHFVPKNLKGNRYALYCCTAINNSPLRFAR